MRCWSFFVFAAVLGAQSQTGEVTTREEVPTFQSSVNLVRVPVVVRDKQGHPLGTLHKEDFQLTDRGKAQPIAQFVIEGSAVAKPAAPQSAPAEMPGEPAASASKLVAPTRFVAFVFDDVHLTLEDLMNARVAALKYIEQGIAPQERVALLTLSGNVSIDFTDDVAKFRETLMKVAAVPPPKHFPPASFYEADQFTRNPGSEMAQLGDPSMPEVLTMQTYVTMDCLPGTLPAMAVNIARDTLRGHLALPAQLDQENSAANHP